MIEADKAPTHQSQTPLPLLLQNHLWSPSPRGGLEGGSTISAMEVSELDTVSCSCVFDHVREIIVSVLFFIT